MNTPDDQELFNLIKQNNEDAFRLIYDKYWDQMFTMAVKKTGSSEDATDIVQELFLDIWRKRNKINIEGSFCSYLFTALKNKAINFRIKKNNIQHGIKLLTLKANPANSETEEISETRELEKIIVKEIANMPKKMRMVFSLSRNHDLPSNTIADLLSISDQTVRNQISKALKRIRHRLVNYGFKSWLINYIFIHLYCTLL